ncbi:uncharacterized protein DNG_06241 [Cephalotrichum gorgonifer]|uniref:SGNH hydrolase-type esterase domain-containing protein n=1 Tax=Cephalotrichum gorgonifer TaxID=2041049 RepID=A0AAE8N180_9PEZI|nr:uncharacterized protein DNG_06241 [Cephalotrichum gorgonifer]
MAPRSGVGLLYRLLFGLLFAFAVASPILDGEAIDIDAYNNGSVVLASGSSLQRRAGNFYLRIMPLGASITYGDPHPPTTGGRGYRKYIRDQLRSRGWSVNMVGSRRYGTDFADNDVEGWPGARVDEVYDHAFTAVPTYKPNLIMLNAGTNDATQGRQAGCGERLERLIRMCFEKSPGVVILVSTLLWNGAADDRVQDINAQYRAVVAKLQLEGLKVQLAEMHDGFITESDIWDGTHPHPSGCQKMASVWWFAFQQVDQKGWLSPPSDNVPSPDGSQNNQCDKVKGSGNGDPRAGMQVLTAGSSRIHDDGTYVHKSQSLGVISNGDAVGSRQSKVYFAQLVNAGGADRGGERDELIVVEVGGDKIYMKENLGGGKFGSPVDINVHNGCLIRGIRWGDVNNDGLDDFICIGREGNMYVSINKGGNPPTFQDVELYKQVPSGYAQENVRLGDIDGDGRLDYCVTDFGGNIYCWRNGGLGDLPAYWQDLGLVFTGKGMGDIAGTRLIDINGDFRADWLWVDNTGRITTWINQRGSDKSLVPSWREAGVTHGGMSREVGRDNILFARLYDSGRPDYILQTPYPFWSDDLIVYQLEAWQNLGSGGKHQKGDGAHWGDMTGTGNDDYVWIDPEGRVVIFVNQNTPPDTSRYKTGWDDKGIVLETGMDRKALHIGDWDNDGKDDIIGVDKRSGALTVWLTRYSSGSFSFQKITLGGTYCTQGWGVGLFDIGPRFHDLTGNGCVDYLCMEPNGRTTGWINNCPRNGNMFNLEWVDQIKFSVDKDRANHRFADVNGDGRADFMWVDKFDGDAQVWYNRGRKREEDRPALHGSIFQFDDQGDIYLGSSRGTNMHYPNLGGIGRADQVQVDPTSAHDDLDADERDYNERRKKKRSVAADNIDEGASQLNITRRLVTSKGSEGAGVESPKIVPRGGSSRRAFMVEWEVTAHLIAQLWMFSRGYPGSGSLHNPTQSQPASQWAFRMVHGCRSSDIERIDHTNLTPLERMGMFLRALGSGVLPDGTATTVPHVDPTVLESFWNDARIAPGVLPNAGSSRGVDSPNEYFWDRFGSQGNRAPMVLCERELNQLKGRIFNLRPEDPPNLWAQDGFDLLLDNSLHDMAARELLMRRMRMVVAVFRYINHPTVLPIIQNNVHELELAVGRLEAYFPGDIDGATQIFREFYPAWYRQATSDARAWMLNRLEEIQDQYTRFRDIAVDPAEMQQFVSDMIDEVRQYIRSPF